jgi:hypothetical protein
MNRRKNKSLTRAALFGAIMVLALQLITGPAAMAMVEEGDNVTGVVAVTDAGYVIMTDTGDYLVVGFDLTDMVGMMVEAIGTVSEGDGGKEIHATSVGLL